MAENVGPQSDKGVATLFGWRIDNLLDAGFTPEQVQRIIREELDWRLALTLVQNGCSHETALRIA
ncbi:MAG TPA: hypothetical protein VLB81_04810 [Gaiellales bacterium]|nr:hypothetical protein [Gaiellales bacterium]